MRGVLAAVLIAVAAYSQSNPAHGRARDLGIAPGALTPGPLNAITDVAAGAVFVGNAFGRPAGSTQVQELGTIETPA